MKIRVQEISRKLRAYALLLVAAMVSVFFIAAPTQAASGINGQLNFQGRLLTPEGATVPDGFYNMQFKIYQDGDGQTAGNTTGTPAGTLKWTESHLNAASQGVVVKNGYLSVQLGSITAFGSSVDWNQDTLWLSINVGGMNATCTPFSNCTPDGEMLPMKRLSSTPYAMNAGQLGGMTASQFIQSTTTPQTANIAIQSAATNSIGAQVLGAASQTADIFQVNANGAATSLFAVGATGATTLQNTTDSASAFSVKNQNGRLVMGVNTTTGTVTLGNITATAGAGVAGKLILADGTNDNFGLTLNTATLTANRTIFLPNADGTLLTTTNGVSLQATTPGTAQSGNFNVNGTGIVGTLQATSASVTGTGGSANITLGATAANTGQITFANSTNTNTAIIQGGATSASYTTVLPTAVGVAGQCLSVGSVAGTTQNLGYVGCLTAANSVELQATTPGTAQTGNFNISGTGIVGTMQTSLVAAADNSSITVRGGNATVLNTNGSDITVTGGAGNGTGVSGLVKLGPTAYNAVVNASCAANCTIPQASVDNYGTIVISSSTSDINITLPPPTNTLAKGRTVYITTDNASLDFTLTTNTGADLIEVAMRKNTTSTMIWSGNAWTPGGASNATTLQATYNNGSNPATTPEIKLDSIRGTIDIQDADTTIGSDILNVRGSNASGLGTVLFGVSNTGRVTIQGTTDDSSAFRVLNSVGDYLFNINSSNNYVISNSIRSAGNEIANPGFESGGLITGGEEGWFGPATASIVNNNAHSGNNSLAITATSANIDVFAGSYYEVNAGDSLFAAGWVKNTAGATGNAGLQITWYNKDKAVIGNSTAYSTTPGTSYIQRNVGAIAPAGTVYARVSATIRSTATTGTFYFDDFYMKRNLESADMTFRNIANSTTGFRIQSANAGNTLFTADTLGNAVRIGDATGSGTDTTVLVVDSATADPTALTGLNGGIFYRSDSGSLKAIVGGAVVDICTTAVTCTGYSASAGSTIQLQATSPGTAQTGNFNITGTGILTKLQTQHNATGSTQTLTVQTGNAGSGNSGNLIIDTGTATGTRGSITIGTGNAAVTMGGTLAIQGGGDPLATTLSLGQASTSTGLILFNSSAGSNTVSLSGPTSAGTSYKLTLPSALGNAGECFKIDATGGMFFQGCGVGVNFNLQDAYNNSGTPADITLTDGKNFQITAADTTTTDPSIVFKLNCTTGCTGTNGRFIVQNSTTDVLSVLPNGKIVLNGPTSIGSGSTADSTQTIFQLDTYAGITDAASTCNSTTNNGALYYNSTMGSIRGCINGAWNDISNPDTLGLLTFGIVPSSGSHPYDLPSLITPGYTGPCRASWAGQYKIHVEPCTAYSNGRRVTVVAEDLYTTTAARAAASDPTAPATDLSTSAVWGHICLNPTTGQPEFTTSTGQTSGTAGMPIFSAAQPTLCIADVKGSTATPGVIDDLYDVRTFTSDMKEAVTTATAVELGMMADSSGASVAPSATCSSGTCSGKLYGLVVATNGNVSSTDPNTIVTSVGPGFVKAISGSAGQFAKASTTAGYATTISAIPNNAFYFSPGNARTSYDSTCTSASNCNGSMYVNFIVR